MFARRYGLRTRGGRVSAVGRGRMWRLCIKIGERLFLSRQGISWLLANQYKMDEEEVQTRWDKASLYNSTEGRLMMGSLWF